MKKLNAGPMKRQKILEAITENISNGELAPGERIIPLRDLAKQFSVSPSVAYRALKDLETDGFLECRGTQGFYVRDQKETHESSRAGVPEEAKRKRGDGRVFLSCTCHSDLTWKYPYAAYAEIRERQFDRMAAFFQSNENFHAHVEQAEPLRVYFAKRPEMLPLFRNMAETGRLTLTGGNLIPDLNLCSGELLVRNLQDGRRYFEETFGISPWIANESDAFGMCAQLPQILVKSGYHALIPGRLGNRPGELGGNMAFRWKGIDGSCITVTPATAEINHTGYSTNVPVIRDEASTLRESMLKIRRSEYPGDLLVSYCCEENLFHESLFFQMEAVNRTEGSHLLQFGSVADYCTRIDPESLPEFSGEFNPFFTGCYTTRIGIKQTLRKAENLLFAAEMAGCAFGKTISSAPWRLLQEASFHDAVCGCHTDAASEDVTRKLAECISLTEQELEAMPPARQDTLLAFNPDSSSGSAILAYRSGEELIPEGVPVQSDGEHLCFTAELPGCGARSFRMKKGRPAPPRPAQDTFSTKFFDVDFRSPYPKIFSRAFGRALSGGEGFGEILFREDAGSMWDEAFLLEPNGRVFLHEEVESITVGDVFFEAVVTGHCLPCPGIDGATDPYWSGFSSLSFRKEYRFYHDLDYFTLRLFLTWKGCNTKIAIRFPVNVDPFRAAALYDVPFGSIERKPYYEVPEQYASTMRPLSSYAHARSGDWPALHWVDYADDSFGVAMANSGTPAHQLAGGAIQAALLRSGTRIEDGRMRPDPGAWDNGEHVYEFAFAPHAPFQTDAALKLGRRLNRKPLAFPHRDTPDGKPFSLPGFNRDNLVISSLRRQEDGSWILRAYEALGRNTPAILHLPPGVSAIFESDLQERQWHPLDPEKTIFAPFEIKTLLLRRK